MDTSSQVVVEKVTLSLVREYLVRKGYMEALHVLTEESSSIDDLYTSRRSLGKDLRLENAMRINKELENPFRSMLEVLVKNFLVLQNTSKSKSIEINKSRRGTRTEATSPIRKQVKSTGTNTSLGLQLELVQSGTQTEDMLEYTIEIDTKLREQDSNKNQSIRNSVPNEVEMKSEASPNPEANGGEDGRANRENREIFENIGQQLQERSPSRINSFRNSLSEDHGSEPEDSIDAKDAPYPPRGPPSSSKAMFTRSSNRNNSSNLLLHSPTHEAAPNALEIKQNLLAEATLSSEENEIRQLVETRVKTSYEESDITFQDLEDYDDLLLHPSKSAPILGECAGGDLSRNEMLHYHKEAEQASPCIAKMLDAKTWANLKTAIFGNKGIGSMEGWIGQGFTFNQKVPLGLTQRKGGPCGVLSAVQCLILKNLLFGSEYFEGDSIPLASNGKMVNLDDNSAITSLSSKRMIALVAAIVEILWKCSTSHSPFPQVAICLSGSYNVTSPAPETYIISVLDELKKYVRFNLHRFDCIGLVYSVVLTRGLERVQEDMDFPNSPLLGQHGYCTQELINLLTIGKAISNSFDNEVEVGEKILKGISSPVDIGLLSLFEHYDSCQVGQFLKCPKYPIWIICSESHFTVLFSNDLSISQRQASDASISNRPFNLYYYDGLAHQEKLIKLTITENGRNLSQPQYRRPVKPSMLNNNMDIGDEDSAPPLEKCIRTKYKNAAINWNDSEPIL